MNKLIFTFLILISFTLSKKEEENKSDSIPKIQAAAEDDLSRAKINFTSPSSQTRPNSMVLCI